ncbi:MAG: hypothetical protein EOM37_11355 [Proteobacteria bacterium]|nr:hypothetical protein [Pseudomonadota bacterium]
MTLMNVMDVDAVCVKIAELTSLLVLEIRIHTAMIALYALFVVAGIMIMTTFIVNAVLQAAKIVAIHVKYAVKFFVKSA